MVDMFPSQLAAAWTEARSRAAVCVFLIFPASGGVSPQEHRVAVTLFKNTVFSESDVRLLISFVSFSMLLCMVSFFFSVKLMSSMNFLI